MIDIRPAQFSDIPLLRQVAIQTQIDTFGAENKPEHMEAFLKEAYNIEKFESEFFEQGSQYYIAWSNEELAGFLRVRITDEAEAYLGKNAIELQRLYVSKEFHGKKIGFMLMQKAITHAKELKFEWLWLGVWERNFKAQEFYKKLGFERFSEHTFLDGARSTGGLVIEAETINVPADFADLIQGFHGKHLMPSILILSESLNNLVLHFLRHQRPQSVISAGTNFNRIR